VKFGYFSLPDLIIPATLRRITMCHVNKSYFTRTDWKVTNLLERYSQVPSYEPRRAPFILELEWCPAPYVAIKITGDIGRIDMIYVSH
jgi:hypothetical protein